MGTTLKWDKIDKDDIHLLTQAGFVAINHNWYAKAQTIFDGLRLMRPKSEVPTIGTCMNLMGQNKFDEALALLKKEAHYFEQNHSPYHHILRAIIFRLTQRFQEAFTELSHPETEWNEYASLAQTLLEDVKNKI